MAKKVSNPEDLSLSVIAFYRTEIERRYQLKNVRKYEEFEQVTDAQVRALRDYFLEHIYPPVDGRKNLDLALARLRGVMKSPKRLRPFMSAGFASMWRLGTNLPSAVKAGISVLDAYHEARNLEQIMVSTALEQGVSPADAGDRKQMLGILADVPEADVLRLVNDIMALFRVLSNTKLLDTAVEFLGTCREIMVKRPGLYDATDVNGITLGRAIVQGGLDLFRKVDPEVFPVMIRGIERIELDWYRSATAGAESR